MITYDTLHMKSLTKVIELDKGFMFEFSGNDQHAK